MSQLNTNPVFQSLSSSNTRIFVWSIFFTNDVICFHCFYIGYSTAFSWFFISSLISLYSLKGELRPKLSPLFLCQIFVSCMEKEYFTKFCANFIRFHNCKVTKFCIQCIWRHARECIKHVTPGFLSIFCYFYGENTSYNRVRLDFLKRCCENAVVPLIYSSATLRWVLRQKTWINFPK